MLHYSIHSRTTKDQERSRMASSGWSVTNFSRWPFEQSRWHLLSLYPIVSAKRYLRVGVSCSLINLFHKAQSAMQNMQIAGTSVPLPTVQSYKREDNKRVETSRGFPQSRRRWRSDSGTTIFGGSLSSPLGFDGKTIFCNHKRKKKVVATLHMDCPISTNWWYLGWILFCQAWQHWLASIRRIRIFGIYMDTELTSNSQFEFKLYLWISGICLQNWSPLHC